VRACVCVLAFNVKDVNSLFNWIEFSLVLVFIHYCLSHRGFKNKDLFYTKTALASAHNTKKAKLNWLFFSRRSTDACDQRYSAERSAVRATGVRQHHRCSGHHPHHPHHRPQGSQKPGGLRHEIQGAWLQHLWVGLGWVVRVIASLVGGTWLSGQRGALGSNPSGGSESSFRSDLLLIARGSITWAPFCCLPVLWNPVTWNRRLIWKTLKVK
jgi:hypothetical protein